MSRLRDLHDAGVSIWLDTLSRELLDSGDFTRLIGECHVTGATSNPTIFAKAITGSRRAADLLRPAYKKSGGRDGFVSFECTPDLAGDSDATIEQALDLWGRLTRPNVMIKVPATEAGVPAIEELTMR